MTTRTLPLPSLGPLITGPGRLWRALSIANKITGFLVALVVVSLVGTSVVSYRSLSHDLELLLGRRLEHIVRTATMLVDGTAHERVVDSYLAQEDATRSPEFIAIRDTLRRVRENNKLTSDIYSVIRPDWAPENMVFITMTNEKPYVGNAMPLHPKVAEVLSGGEATHSALYTDSEGTWISAFAPITVTDAGGKRTVAVLEIDYNARDEVREAKLQLARNIGIPALAAFLLALLTGNLAGKALSRPIVRLAEATRSVAGGALDVQVAVDSEDEIGVLGGGFNQMVRDLKRQRDQLEDYAKNLEKMVAERTAQLAEANRNIQSMMNSVGQGFFMFDPSGTCREVRSRACSDLLLADPPGKSLGEVLGLSEQKGAELGKWIPLLFEDLMPFDDLKDLGPQLLEHPQGKHVTLQYFPVHGEGGAVESVVVVATDKTAERDANLRTEREKAHTQMILKLIKNKKRFLGFVRETRAAFTQLEELLTAPAPDYGSVFRLVHTFKSAVASFSVAHVAEFAHAFETELSAARSLAENGGAPDVAGIRARLGELQALFSRFLEEARGIFGPVLDEGGAVFELPAGELKAFAEKLGNQAPRELSEEFTRAFLAEPVRRYFTHYDDIITLVAARQGKEIAPLAIRGGELRLVAEPYAELFSSLIHSFRNAIDHGIEKPDERIAAGKPPSGTIEVEFSREERESTQGIRIEIRDDGRGINPAAIREKLLRKGFESVREESDEEVIQHVFDNGFSTREQVTELSGRGIGMDAIRYCVSTLRGSCRMTSRVGAGSTLSIWVPEVSS